jgi:predicted nucleic acid-binding protein
MAGIEQQLAGHQIVGLDTAVFIYHLEAHPTYLPLTTIILQRVQAGQCTAVVSTVTIMELTVHPWRQQRADIARQYEALLAHFPHLQIVDLTRDVARRAAQLQVYYNLRPADALQVATAVTHQATIWISNDKKLRQLSPRLDILILDDFVTQ